MLRSLNSYFIFLLIEKYFSKVSVYTNHVGDLGKMQILMQEYWVGFAFLTSIQPGGAFAVPMSCPIE